MTNTKGQYKGEFANSPEIPDGSKYETRVKERAEGMAEIMHPTAFKDRGHSLRDSNYWQIMVAKYIPIARMAVQKEAVAFKIGAVNAYGSELDGVELSAIVASWQKFYGLISSPNLPEETGK